MTRFSKIVSVVAGAMALGTAAFAQVTVGIAEEKAGPFSYYSRSLDQLGFKDCPEAMGLTDGGIFSNAFYAVEFLYGEQLKPATKRVVELTNDYIPVIGYTLNENELVWKLEAYSVPAGFKPENDLISYVRWTVTNKGKKAQSSQIGFKLMSFSADKADSEDEKETKNFLKHNGYCTPWYGAQFMNEADFMRNNSNIKVETNTVYIANHLALVCPGQFDPRKGVDAANEFAQAFELAPGESRQFVFRIPVVPVLPSKIAETGMLLPSDFDALKGELISFWNKELSAVSRFSVPEKKVMDMYRMSYFNLLIARDLLPNKVDLIQRCNEFQYDYFYVRDNAYFARVYDMLGLPQVASNILQPYFIYDAEGNPMQFRDRTGIYNKKCDDYWGQVLWAFGAHIQQTGDTALLKKVYKLLPNHIKEFGLAVEKDARGLWPESWPYDNEHINGHYTGHSFWAILGLRYAVLMANEMGNKTDADEWQKLLDKYRSNFMKELKELTAKTGGYIPPGMDNPADGFDWANASAGLYPFEAIDKNDPMVRTTLETVRNYNFQEGVSTYSGANAWVAKGLALSGKDFPADRGLHHYETFYVTNGNLVIGEQEKVVEDLYAILVHTSSTHGGFEWRPTPWGNRSTGVNRQPHGWMAARYIELIRNMLVREEAKDVHLMSAISPEWLKEGKQIVVDKAPTYFGEVSYTLDAAKNSFTVNLNNHWNDKLGKVYFHLPWFISPETVLLDGKSVSADNGVISLPKEAKKISVSWKKRLPLALSFERGVDIYLDKYYNRPAHADYVHLFPELSAPGFAIDRSTNTIALFSPDNVATVYYTTDGSEPGAASASYKKPVQLNGVALVKAICIDANGVKSDCKTIQIN